MKRKVAITTSSFAEYNTDHLSLLKVQGFKVVINPFGRKIEEAEVLKLCSGCIGIISGTEHYNSNLLRKLNELKVISRCGVGLENIDMHTARELGIKVFNTPDAPTLAVAELTIGLIIALMRKVVNMDRTMRNGIWKKEMGSLLQGKKVGIVGFGKIGRKVAELLVPFRCQIAYTDPLVKKKSNKFRKKTLKNLLKWADILTIHCSTKEKILGKDEFKLMKKGSWLLNLSRGGVVDEKALYKFLKNGYLAGAALDVFTEEPYFGELKNLDNVIVTPHIGSYARESRIEMEREAVKNLLKGLKACGATK